MFGLNTNPFVSLNAQMENAQSEVQISALQAQAAVLEANSHASAAFYWATSAQAAVVLARTTFLAMKEGDKAREVAALTSSFQDSAERARERLAKKMPSKTEIHTFVPANYFGGKVNVIDAKDFKPNQKVLLTRLRLQIQFTFKETIQHFEKKNVETLLAMENYKILGQPDHDDDEIVGLLLGEKRNVLRDESKTPETEFRMIDSLKFPNVASTTTNRIKLILLLEAMRKTKELGIQYFSFEYEIAKAGNLYKFYYKEQNVIYEILDEIATDCAIEIHSKNREEVILGMNVVFKNVFYDVTQYQYEKAKHKFENIKTFF